MHVEEVGSGLRVVLVHGSGGSGWPAQQELASAFRLVMPTRSGYAPNPPLERIDFEDQADELLQLLEPGDHLVGHSYGGVVSLLAAARAPELRSLTVSEPPAFGVARAHPAVAELIAELGPLWPTDLEPEPFVRRFAAIVGSASLAVSPLPPDLEAGVRAMMAERPPWEAEIPLEELARAPFRKLVVSGGHNPAFDAVCDALEEQLGAERAVLPGAGHSIPRAPGFNERLVQFLEG